MPPALQARSDRHGIHQSALPSGPSDDTFATRWISLPPGPSRACFAGGRGLRLCPGEAGLLCKYRPPPGHFLHVLAFLLALELCAICPGKWSPWHFFRLRFSHFQPHAPGSMMRALCEMRRSARRKYFPSSLIRGCGVEKDSEIKLQTFVHD